MSNEHDSTLQPRQLLEGERATPKLLDELGAILRRRPDLDLEDLVANLSAKAAARAEARALWRAAARLRRAARIAWREAELAQAALARLHLKRRHHAEPAARPEVVP